MIDLFDTWRVTQPPNSGYNVLWWGNRVMAQGSIQTISLNRGYKYRSR